MTIEKKDNYTRYNIEISDDDIYEAMKKMEGYIDITLSDFRELYHIAFNHAMERMIKGIKAKDIMTSKVVHVTGDTVLPKIVKIMAANNISGVPVVDNRMRVSGIISENDILYHMGNVGPKPFMNILTECLGDKRCFATNLGNLIAEEIMTSPVITAESFVSVFDINCTLMENKINRIPIVNDKKELIGIVSRADTLKAQFGNGEN